MVRGIVIARHNEAREKLIHIVKCAFSWNCVCREPLIHQGCSRSNKEMHHRRGENYIGVDTLIKGLQERQNDAIIDVRFEVADCATYNKDPTSSLINRWEKREFLFLFSRFQRLDPRVYLSHRSMDGQTYTNLHLIRFHLMISY